MNLFFHQLFVSAVLCWFSAISKHVNSPALCSEAVSVTKSGTKMILVFWCRSSANVMKQSKTSAPAGGTTRRGCHFCRAAHYLVKGLYKIPKTSSRLSLCKERCKTELIEQHKMLPLGTHKAKDQLRHLSFI